MSVRIARADRRVRRLLAARAALDQRIAQAQHLALIERRIEQIGERLRGQRDTP